MDADAPSQIQKVGVIGAGTMGAGIAMAFANSELPVTLVDVSAEAVQRGLAIVVKTYQSSVAKGRLTQIQADARTKLITGSHNLPDVADCDVVIEAVYENFELKQTICKQLGGICKPGAIIATNTSSLDVNALAAASGRPSNFVGMHFFSPANVMKLLEVVRGDGVSEQTLTTVLALGKQIGKIAVVSGVCWGFIGNRMLEGYLRKSEFLLMEGASPSQIDGAMEEFGMAMGPCRMIDMAGVDVAAKVVLERQKASGLPDDPSYRAVVRALFEHGHMGQKSARGYYKYEGRTAVEDEDLLALFAQLATRFQIRRRPAIPNTEIVERCLLPLMNEGSIILDEGIAYRGGDIDVVWVNGYGFPAWRGGPMHMASVLGEGEVAARLAHYAATRGNPYGYWTPSTRLSGRRASA